MKIEKTEKEDAEAEAAAAAAAAPQPMGGLESEGETVISLDEYMEARLVDDLSSYLVRFLHKGMLRRARGEQVTLPLRVRAPVWPSIINVLCERYAGTLHLSSREAIEHLLGQNVKKMFDKGSYAIITPPLIIRFDARKQDLVAELHYAIYNQFGCLQFPHSWA